MELEDQYAVAQGLSERRKRRVVNQMAQRLSQRHYEQVRAQLQGQLDNAEMRGRDGQLLVEWCQQLEGPCQLCGGVGANRNHHLSSIPR